MFPIRQRGHKRCLSRRRSRNAPDDLRDKAPIASRSRISGIGGPAEHPGADRVDEPDEGLDPGRGPDRVDEPAQQCPDDPKRGHDSSRREAWLCVLQGADGNEETELITLSEMPTAPARARADQRRADHLHAADGHKHARAEAAA